MTPAAGGWGMTRVNVDNDRLPGVQSARTITFGTEMHREEIFSGGDYIGEIVYVRRKRSKFTEYGWRPAKSAAQSRLTDKVSAIERLM